jgi:hypothetical protein
MSCHCRTPINHVNVADSYSAIPRFESWRLSQPARSLPCRFPLRDIARDFRGLGTQAGLRDGDGRDFGPDDRAFVAGVSAAVFSISVFNIRDRFEDGRDRFAAARLT